MHAFLLISKNRDSVSSEIKSIIGNGIYNPLEFQLQKIEDARNLNSFLKLSIPNKTAVIIKDFQNATEECVNAVLKNLEEPQDDLIFLIHSTNENQILPTIISRCQIVRFQGTIANSDHHEIEEFVKMNISQKFVFLNNKKSREDAIQFCDQLIQYYAESISRGKEVNNFINNTKMAIKLKKSLLANGNVNLQSLRFIIHITD